MHLKYLICFLILILTWSIQGQNVTDRTSTLTSVTAATTTSLETIKSNVSMCLGDRIDPPNCTKCAFNFENQNGKCIEKKVEMKPTMSIGRRIFFIFVGCFLTVFIIVGMLFVYGRVNPERRRRSSINQDNIGNPSNSNSTGGNPFENLLRSIGLNNLTKRRPFNFFSISNNPTNSSNQYRQAETSRSHLNENPDEALLFDDPYADGGLNNSSVNPYKSLTLAVT